MSKAEQVQQVVVNSPEQEQARKLFLKRRDIMKSTIKVLVAQQVEFKNQRKTVHMQGKRTVEPAVAAYKHAQRRIELRAHYVAYNTLRGHSLERIGMHPDHPAYLEIPTSLLAHIQKTSDEVR